MTLSWICNITISWPAYSIPYNLHHCRAKPAEVVSLVCDQLRMELLYSDFQAIILHVKVAPRLWPWGQLLIITDNRPPMVEFQPHNTSWNSSLFTQEIISDGFQMQYRSCSNQSCSKHDNVQLPNAMTGQMYHDEYLLGKNTAQTQGCAFYF